MLEFIELGSVPHNEECIGIGDPNYRVNAIRECWHFIQGIRTYLEMEPDGARLTCKGFPQDMGTYYEVVVKYDPEDEAALKYADMCEPKAPATWEDCCMKPPELLLSAGRSR